MNPGRDIFFPSVSLAVISFILSSYPGRIAGFII